MAEQHISSNTVTTFFRRPAAEVERRSLNRSEAADIIEEIRRSPDITGYSRREWSGKRDVFVLVPSGAGEFIGAVLVHHLFRNWSEIAVVFIREDFRGQGFGRMLVHAVSRTLKNGGARQLMFFSEGAMEKIAEECGFRIFQNEGEFVRGRRGRWLFLKVVYKAQWLCNLYRIRELRRKAKAFDSRFEFKVAFLEP